MKIHLVALAACATLGAAIASSQESKTPTQVGTISGIITDKVSKQPIAGVTVVLQGTPYGATSRETGRYVILAPPGTYTLFARHGDYPAAEIPGVIVDTDITRSLDIQVPRGTPERGWTRVSTLDAEQAAIRPKQPRPDDPFSKCLIPPELIMAHQAELQLQDAQRTRIVADVKQAQANFTDAQWTLTGEQRRLEQLLKGATIDEAATMRQLDRILAIEQDVKRSQLQLLVRVRNALTSQQVRALMQIRKEQAGTTPDGSRWVWVPDCGS